MTFKEGLKAAFPDAKRIIRTEIYLQDKDRAAIEKKSSIKLKSSFYVRYKVLREGKVYRSTHSSK